MKKAVLALEDGTLFTGQAIGATGENWGEVVFNTSMTGYEGVLTDPSYCGQIVVMTYPLIGNYGLDEEDFEAKRSFVRGFVIRENCEQPSNWRAKNRLSQYLANEGIIGISGIDTRALTRHLRNYGTMRGVISTERFNRDALVAKAQTLPQISDQEFISQVTNKEPYVIPGTSYRVALIDLGAKLNIMRCLQQRGCEIMVWPPFTPVSKILSCHPDGIMISNGPGDPVTVPKTIETIRELIGKKPIFGICLGHQLIALALGAKTYKLKFGHRGANHPVKDLATGKVYISSHNHGFAVDEESLSGLDINVSHRNLNDGTVEGIKHKYLPVFSVQYHPEAAPGPRDSEYLFDEFIKLMEREGR
ncbi:MAG: glutamine-hydrolyzing carbamoyl-phosphate synthase small subunit [Peptococcaceae bacterium]|nr:glutamine-hydrolyzing carbamoyl-phosphate synthase small subunit [Peptococcaceae bacterium]